MPNEKKTKGHPSMPEAPHATPFVVEKPAKDPARKAKGK